MDSSSPSLPSMASTQGPQQGQPTTPAHSAHPANQATTPGGPGAGPQIRSRITVVCAECKRLKLKCDRRNPCGSCVKRDTVVRCIYSPAAAEKVDLHSLNNRLTAVESQLALLSSCPLPPTNSSSALSYPSSSSLNSITTSSSLFGEKKLDNTGLGIGSCVRMALTELAAWMDDEAREAMLEVQGPAQTRPMSPVKSEPDTVPLVASRGSPFVLSSSAPSLAAVPAPEERTVLYAAASRALRLYPGFAPGNAAALEQQSERAIVWAQNSSHCENDNIINPLGLSSPATDVTESAHFAQACVVLALGTLALSLEQRRISPPDVLRMRGGLPSDDEVCVLADGGAIRRGSDSSAVSGVAVPKGRPRAQSGVSAARRGGKDADGKEKVEKGGSKAAVKGRDKPPPAAGDPPSALVTVSEEASPASDAQALVALARAALSVSDAEGNSNAYSMQWVRAMGTLVLCGLYEARVGAGREGSAGREKEREGFERAFVLLGQLINGARLVGLSRDESGSSGREEREERRRLWWSVVWWDIFLSDTLGHTPLISRGTFTTRMPSTVLVKEEHENTDEGDSLGADVAADVEYMSYQFRLAQLVRSVKKRVDELPLTIDLASSLEGEIMSWLSELPSRLRFESEPGVSEVASADDLPSARRAMLLLPAHRMVLKLYRPFIQAISPTSSSVLSSSVALSHQSSSATVNAAHVLVRVMRALLLGTNTWARAHVEWEEPARDTCVVCAYSVMRAPGAVWVGAAMEDANVALDMVKEAQGKGVEPSVVAALDKMVSSAGSAKVSGTTVIGLGLKRKRDTASPEPVLIPAPSGNASLDIPATIKVLKQKDSEQQQLKAKIAEKERERQRSSGSASSSSSKKGSYPPVGVRVRPGREGPPAIRQRLEGVSPTLGPSPFSPPPSRTPVRSSALSGLQVQQPQYPPPPQQQTPQTPTSAPHQESYYPPQSQGRHYRSQSRDLGMHPPTQDGGYRPPLPHVRSQSSQANDYQMHSQAMQQDPMTPITPQVATSPTSAMDFSAPFGTEGEEPQAVDMGAMPRDAMRRYAVQETPAQGQYMPPPIPYDAARPYASSSSPNFGSSGQLPNAGSPYGPNTNGGPAVSPFTPMPPHGHPAPPSHNYPGPPSHPEQQQPMPASYNSQGYLMPSDYRVDYDSSSGMNNLGMPTGRSGMSDNGTAPVMQSTPRDVMYAMEGGVPEGMFGSKPSDGLQPAFGVDQQHQQQQQQQQPPPNWMQNQSQTAGGPPEYWNSSYMGMRD